MFHQVLVLPPTHMHAEMKMMLCIGWSVDGDKVACPSAFNIIGKKMFPSVHQMLCIKMCPMAW